MYKKIPAKYKKYFLRPFSEEKFLAAAIHFLVLGNKRTKNKGVAKDQDRKREWQIGRLRK